LTLIRLALVLLLASRAVSAQAVGGKNVQLGVTVIEIVRQGDTTAVTYVLTIEPTSAEALFAFTVDAPSVLSVSHPLPPQDWVPVMRYAGYAVARWSVLSEARLHPGSDTPELTYRAIGLPGIVDARVTGQYDRDGGNSSDEEDLFLAHSSALRVVGIVRSPDDATPRGFLERLQRDLAEACTLGWMNDQGACDLLNGNAEIMVKALDKDAPARRSAVRTFIESLDALRGRNLGESAYQLFRFNAELIAERAR
jgi:hypothetical protein